LGKAQSQVERYADAERSYRRALAIGEDALGPDDPEVALVLNNLAVNYKRQDRIPEALDCLRRSLAIREAKLGPDHPNVALVLNNLGNCLRLERKYAEAETVLTRAMAILGTPGRASRPMRPRWIALLAFAQPKAGMKRRSNSMFSA